MPAAQKRCFCAVVSDSVHRHSLLLCQEIGLVDNIFISAQCEFKENRAMMMMTMRMTMTVMMMMMMMMTEPCYMMLVVIRGKKMKRVRDDID